MSNNLDFQDDRILVERHYMPYRLYRDIYMGYQQPPNSFASSLYSSPNNVNQHIPILTPIRTNSRERQIHEEQPTFETPSEIRNLVSNLLNNRMPFELQVSTIPLGSGGVVDMVMDLGLMQNNTNPTPVLNNRNRPLTLSNINIISTVLRFDDISISSALADNSTDYLLDTCSICQQSFNDNDITRMLNSCKHIFHLTCIDTWLSEHSTCPSCRHNLIDDLTSTTSTSSTTSTTSTSSTTSTTSSSSSVQTNNSNTQVSNLDNADNIVIEEVEVDNGNGNTTSNTLPNLRRFSNLSYGGINNLRDDINHFINIGTPLVNSLLPNTNVFSNTSPLLNASQINNNVNTLFENINPFITAFTGLLNGGTSANSNTSTNFRMYSSM